MLKSISNLGSILNKSEQKEVNGGYLMYEENDGSCPWNMCKNIFGRCQMFQDHCA
jgi:hypothetical protein